MAALNKSVYGQGELYPPALENNMAALSSAGWTSIVLSLFHIDEGGSLYFNDTEIVSGGSYGGDPAWPPQLKVLMDASSGSTVTTLLASFGGWEVGDFGNVKAIYEANGASFSGTPLEANFQAFYATFEGTITLIDMDVENTYDQPSFVALCQMLGGIGFGITFCPYSSNDSFWTDSLSQLNASNPGLVRWWNLQCYAGGSGNDPQDWADSITGAIPGFDTNGYILASDSAASAEGGDDPAAVKALLSHFKGETCVGGAFIWTADTIIKNADGSPMQDYVQAIEDALG